MLWKKLMKNTGDYRVLIFAHTMLDDDNGLSFHQYDALQTWVYDEIGATVEMIDLFNAVRCTDDRWYVKEAA